MIEEAEQVHSLMGSPKNHKDTRAGSSCTYHLTPVLNLSLESVDSMALKQEVLEPEWQRDQCESP